jgi:hypothetical protein
MFGLFLWGNNAKKLGPEGNVCLQIIPNVKLGF